MAGAGHPVAEDTAVTYMLARLPSAYTTVTTVLLGTRVDLMWGNLLPAQLAVDTDAKEAGKMEKDPSAAISVYRTNEDSGPWPITPGVQHNCAHFGAKKNGSGWQCNS